MRILQLHCDSIEYKAVSREIPAAEDAEPGTTRLEDLLVAFVAVERGDDADVARRAAEGINESLRKLGCSRLLIYPYAHLSSDLAPPQDALERVGELAGAAGAAQVMRAPFGWTKSYAVSVKAHPLAESFRVIEPDGARATPARRAADAGAPEAVVSEPSLHSEWRVLTPDGRLHEASSFDFGAHPGLGRLYEYEISKRRGADDAPAHVALMKRMGIADYDPASDSGNMRFFPNGRLIKSLIERYVTDRVRGYGGCEVETPIMYDTAHPSMRSYFERFPARQYNIDAEGRRFFLRFAACFGQFLMAGHAQLSHHNMPFRLYELTRYSFRREQSGELVGLRRLRAFTMPDCHAFCTDIAQAVAELEARFELSRDVIARLGLAESDYEMSMRLTREFYDGHAEAVSRLAARHGKPVLVEMWSERFFYFVLKWEFNYVDVAGKASALSTDQIDVENGRRYNIEYVDESGAARHPVILHNSPSGAVERIIYALLENAARDARAGKKPRLPLWLAPTQVRIIPLGAEFAEFAARAADELEAAGARVDIDDRNESVGKRIRQAEIEWIRYVLVVGNKEAGSGKLSVRDRETGQTSSMAAGELAAAIAAQIEGMPQARLNMPRLLSARPQIMI